MLIIIIIIKIIIVRIKVVVVVVVNIITDKFYCIIVWSTEIGLKQINCKG